MDCKKRNISAVSDFPKGCGEHGRAVASTLNNLLEAVQEIDFLYDSESEATSAVASGEQRGIDMTKSLNLEGLSGPSESLNMKLLNCLRKL